MYKHIISKKETCLVESYNSSIRDTFARFRKITYNVYNIKNNKPF